MLILGEKGLIQIDGHNKGIVFKWFLLLFFFLVAGCATTQETAPKKYLPAPPPPKPTKAFQDLKPAFKSLSPLDQHHLDLSVKGEDFRNILRLIAHEAGLNLIIQKEVNEVVGPEEGLITAEFQEMSLREILEAILASLGLGYEVRHGVLYVQAYQERIFDLSFLFTLRGTKFDLGGDVLGGESGNQGISGQGGNQEIISPLKGNFELSGKTPHEKVDIYKSLKENLKNLLSEEGRFSLNQLTGTLWVRDRVPNILRVERYVHDLERRYGRQVLIEAKILEVGLSKEHELGIQWQALLENDLKDTVYLSSNIGFLWNNSDAFVLNFKATPYFEAIIRAIERYGQVKTISNPRLRVLHGQSALISVGRSISYIKEINRELSSGDNLTVVETDVQTSAVFDGLLFGVTPYIAGKDEITLHIVPIKSEVEALHQIQVGEDLTVTLPQVNLRETSTVIRVHPNDLVIIAGLIMDRHQTNEQSVPLASDLPGIGHLFRNKTKSYRKVEMVILLRVQLI